MLCYGVVGNPIAHSLSPMIHNFLFSHFGINAHYEKIHLLNPCDLRSKLLTLNGANITLPYKTHAFEICDEVSQIAQEIEAVNTIFRRDSKLFGFNTDAFGFWECIASLEIKNALILGAGGSARAIGVMLEKKGVEVFIHNRTAEKLDFFTKRNFSIQEQVLDREYDLLINTTSAGLDGKSLPLSSEILVPLLSRSKYLFDVIYPSSQALKGIEDFKLFLSHRPPTRLLDFAQRGMDGLEMLLYQALFAFEIFSQGRYCFEELRALFYNAAKISRECDEN